MTLEEFYQLLLCAGIPVTYRRWEDDDKPALPYIVYSLDGTENFFADNKVYHGNSVVNVTVHTNLKNIPLENRLEGIFNDAELVWDAYERENEDEKMIEVWYQLTI